VLADDRSLLLSYAARHDAEAFSLLVRRYSGMVYAVACRVTGNVATADDVTQDCFLTLSRQAASIRGSLPAWLHRVALNRAMEVNRSNSSRRQREAAIFAQPKADSEATWGDIQPYVDSALAELPDELREPLVQHFLLGRSHVEVAANLGVSRTTVARRLQDGVDLVRRQLRHKGVICGAALLAAGLAQSAPAAVPGTLAASLGKMAIAAPAKAAATGGIAAFVGANIKLICAITAAVVAGAAITYDVAPKVASSNSAQSKWPRVAGLDIKGDPETQDSFSLAFAAAAGVFGKAADYETVFALSGNSFAPGIAPKEARAKAWWHMQGWMADLAMETVAGRYGLMATRMGIPAGSDARDGDERLEAGDLDRQLELGSVIMVSQGWHSTDMVLPYSGLITGKYSDGSWSGAVVGANSRIHVAKPVSAWALAEGQTTLTTHDADVAALRAAVARIRGQRPYQATSQRVYGLSAMDLWIKEMSNVTGFCPCGGCQSRLHDASAYKLESAYENAVFASAACEVTARYLRRIAGDFPAAARPHLESAAGRYDHIVALLGPCMQQSGPQSYVSILGDLNKQRAHVANVLGPVKTEYGAIAQDLEMALNSM
jgi:RNA polymerase sigma factor (sigma-70 family)